MTKKWETKLQNVLNGKFYVLNGKMIPKIMIFNNLSVLVFYR